MGPRLCNFAHPVPGRELAGGRLNTFIVGQLIHIQDHITNRRFWTPELPTSSSKPVFSTCRLLAYRCMSMFSAKVIVSMYQNQSFFYLQILQEQNVSGELNMYVYGCMTVSAYKYMLVLAYLCVYCMYRLEYMYQCKCIFRAKYVYQCMTVSAYKYSICLYWHIYVCMCRLEYMYQCIRINPTVIGKSAKNVRKKCIFRAKYV